MTYSVPDSVVRRAQNGNEHARKEIIRTFERPIRVTVSRFLRTRYPNDVEDFVQDIFVKIFAHLGDFDFSRRVKFSTWIYTFVRNHCFDQLKRKRLPVVPQYIPPDEEEGSPDWLARSDPPEVAAERNEFVNALRRALNDLPDELVRIFKMREFYGLEFHAIAKRLRLPLGTVKSKHYRALDRLRFLMRSFQFAF